MKKINASVVIIGLISSLAMSFILPSTVMAASTPTLGTAGTYGILSSTFTRNIGLTAITGDLGYTTLSGGGTHSVSGSTFIVPPAQAGTDQATALSALNLQACTFTFAAGAIDLASDVTHGPLGVYAPGVYCTGAASAASIGTAGITISGAGTHIFRVDGALTTVANSNVTMGDGASSCDVFWTGSSAVTLGANTTFKGVVINDSGITVGNMTTWNGRALSFGGTVTMDTDTITQSCDTAAVTPTVSTRRYGTINVVKLVINDGGGKKTVADFPLFINGMPVVSGETNTFQAPALRFQISETSDANYTQSFSGDCGLSGGLNLNPGDNKFCVITNDDIKAPTVALVPPLIDVVKVVTPNALPGGPGSVTYTNTLRNIGTVPVSNITMVGDTCKSALKYISGDTNNDKELDLTEAWIYSCSTTLAETHTSQVVATGWANGLSAVDIAGATVVVGVSTVPPLIHVTNVPSPLALSAGGGMVTFTKTVTNPGTVALSNVRLTDDKCSPVQFTYGDTNNDNKLDVTETWIYTCGTKLTKSATHMVIAEGDANGLTARDIALATVVVAVPKLPNTGYTPINSDLPWPLTALGVLFFAAFTSVLVLKKHSI